MATNKYSGQRGSISLTNTVLPSAWTAFVDEADFDTSRDMEEATQFAPPNNARQFEAGLVGATTLRFAGFAESATIFAMTNWLSTTITDCTITYTPVSGKSISFVGYDANLRLSARVGSRVRWELTAQWNGITAPTIS